MAKSKRKSQKPLNHHIVYAFDGTKHEQKDVRVPIYPIEHYITTLMQRRGKLVSKGFLDHLKYFIWEKETTGEYVDLRNSPVLSTRCSDTIPITQGGKTNGNSDSNGS